MDSEVAARPNTMKAGSLTEVFVGLLWLATSAWVARATYVGTGLGFSGALADAVGSLPSTVAATMFTSAAVANALAGRFRGAGTRLLVGLGTGTAFGGLAAAGIRFGYGSGAAIGVLAVVVGVAGVVGGAAAALPGPVIEAALWGTTWVLFFGVIFGVLSPQLINLFGGGPTASESDQHSAQGMVALVESVAVGVIGVLQTTMVLRRDRPAWLWQVFACSLPGGVLLAAEGLIRLGGSKLASVLPPGTSVVSLTDAARLRHALIVAVVGLLLGAQLARRAQPDFD
jgi:hypothetical protein